MTPLDMKLIELIEKQMKLERFTAKSLGAMAAKTNNMIPKLIFKGIQLDSTKHAQMYATLISMAAGHSISKVEHYEMRKALERHVANENIMLAQAQKITRTLKDNQMKPLLQMILADEKRHHKTLASLLKMIAVEEKVSEDDWWGFLNEWSVFST